MISPPPIFLKPIFSPASCSLLSCSLLSLPQSSYSWRSSFWMWSALKDFSFVFLVGGIRCGGVDRSCLGSRLHAAMQTQPLDAMIR